METRPGPGKASAPLAPRAPAPASLAASGVPLVFAGSCERDVALAKTFWNSVTLQPPLESRLSPRRTSVNDGSAASSRRGSNVSGRNDISARPSLNRREEEKIQGAAEVEKNDMKKQYLKKAKKKEEIMSLLKKQREERIRKESLSNPNKSKIKLQESKGPLSEADREEQESVKALN